MVIVVGKRRPPAQPSNARPKRTNGIELVRVKSPMIMKTKRLVNRLRRPIETGSL